MFALFIAGWPAVAATVGVGVRSEQTQRSRVAATCAKTTMGLSSISRVLTVGLSGGQEGTMLLHVQTPYSNTQLTWVAVGVKTRILVTVPLYRVGPFRQPVRVIPPTNVLARFRRLAASANILIRP